jgi:hypothetical protein
VSTLPVHAHRSPAGALPADARIPALRNRAAIIPSATWRPQTRPVGIPRWVPPAKSLSEPPDAS